MQRYNGSYMFGSDAFHKELNDITPGCFVFSYEMYDDNDNLIAVEPLTMHKF